MMKRLVCAGVAAMLLASCGGGSKTQTKESTAGNAGSITIAGSTALLPLVKESAVEYQSKHADVKISVSGGGSMVGITQAAQRGVDIGDSDIPAPDHPELVDHRVAVVTFAVVANPKSGIKNLTPAQIRGIFSGRITNFNQVGGADQTITIVNRPRSSGTRAVFVKKLLAGQQPSENGLTQDSSGTVATMVAQTPGVISYLAGSYVKPGLQTAVSIGGIAPTDTNVRNGKYPYWSYEHMLTNGQPSAQIAAFIAYVKDNKALLRRLGFIPVDSMNVR